VLLLDETGLEQRGIRTIRRLRRLAPATRVLVLATGLGKEARERAMAAGAGGLFEMQSDLATLVQAIRTVAAGEVWNLHPAPDRLPPTNSVNRADGRLTRRESDIADCVGRGLRNRQIAAYLNISPETVKTHLSNIFRKLELEGRIGLSALAQRRTGPENRRTPDSRGEPKPTSRKNTHPELRESALTTFHSPSPFISTPLAGLTPPPISARSTIPRKA
jgi:DNA-binding NarL/FixJ family response regulator